MITNSVSKVNEQKKFPLLVCNNTNKTIRLNKGNVIARVEEVNGGELIPLTEVTQSFDELDIDSEQVKQEGIPEEYKEELSQLLKDNADLFAVTDMELGRTDSATMKVDTGNHPPIRIKPYRTPLNQRPVVEKAVDDMLAANIIRPSNSSWSFPILLVPKKDTVVKKWSRPMPISSFDTWTPPEFYRFTRSLT